MALSRAFTGSSVIGSRWANKPALRVLRAIARGGACAATALVPVFAFVALLDPNGPLRGTRSPDPLPMPDATAGGLDPAGIAEALTFRHLAFTAPDEDRTAVSGVSFLEHAPAAIKALDGKLISITGFMIPVDMDGWNVRRCVIVPSQMNCCYGQSPRFCEFIVADLTGANVRLALDQPVMFTGTLQVGDVSDGGTWSAFYSLDCTAAERR